MSRIHHRVITRRVAQVLCAALAATSLWVATAPPAHGVALVLVLFMQDGQPNVMWSDGSHVVTMSTEVGGNPIMGSRDSHRATYDADAAVNELLLRLSPQGADAGTHGGDSEILWNSPLKTGTKAWKFLTQNDHDDAFPAFYDPSFPGPIAFVSKKDGDNEIYLMDRAGREVARLTDNDDDDTEPAWTPDGKIVFTSNRDGDSDIYVMGVDGSPPTNLTDDSLAYDSQPDVSPDGKTIVFMSERSGNQDVWLMNRDGSDPTRLTESLVTERDPVWSPYGDIIFFTGGSDGDYDVYSMATDGQVVAKLTDNRVADYAMDATIIPPPHVRTARFLRGGGDPHGRLKDYYGMPGCIKAMRVYLQRRTSSGWQPLADTTTDATGRFGFKKALKTGRYRILVPRSKPKVPLRDIVCTRVTAPLEAG